MAAKINPKKKLYLTIPFDDVDQMLDFCKHHIPEFANYEVRVYQATAIDMESRTKVNKFILRRPQPELEAFEVQRPETPRTTKDRWA